MKLNPFKIGKRCWLAVAFSLTLAGAAFGGQIIDRVVADVNGHVVLQSDWEEELHFEAFSNARDADSFSAEERKAALDRLIDQELLREQVRPSQPAPAEQVAVRLAEVRKIHPDCSTDEKWLVKLQHYGLSQSALERHLADQIQLMRLVEDRLRPAIQVDQKAVEAYYNDQLLPEMKRAGNRATPLTEIFGKIKDLLAERKMNELLSGWLANLRSGSQIVTPESNATERNR